MSSKGLLKFTVTVATEVMNQVFPLLLKKLADEDAYQDADSRILLETLISTFSPELTTFSWVHDQNQELDPVSQC